VTQSEFTCTLLALLRKCLILSGAGEGNRTLVSIPAATMPIYTANGQPWPAVTTLSVVRIVVRHMASLRRIPGSRYWIACITQADGTRTNKSTKTTDRSLAKKIAERFQEAEDGARAGRLVEDHARKLFNEILDRAGQDQLTTETVEHFLSEWLKGKTNSGTAERYAHTVRLFLASLEKKSQAVITAISHRDIVRFIQQRQEGGAAPKTIIVDVKTLNTAFNLARKLGHIQHNPVEKALALHPIEVVSSERKPFSRSQVQSLLNVATGDWKTAILLGYYTGARLSDCADMKWDNVNMAEGVLDYIPKKTRRKKKRVVVPLHSELSAHLERIASTDEPQTCLCPSLAGRSSGGKTGLSEEFKRLMALAEIDSETAAGAGKKRKFSKLSFHSLRHSFNSDLANLGIDQETRMALTGHSTVAINRDYTHLDVPKLRNAIEKLPPLNTASP
jgi:integrase